MSFFSAQESTRTVGPPHGRVMGNHQSSHKENFEGYSTRPGELATIHPDDGSTFFIELAEYLPEHYQTMDVSEMFLKVKQAVFKKKSRVRGSDGSIQQFKQIPEERNTLMKQLYLTDQPKLKVILLLVRPWLVDSYRWAHFSLSFFLCSRSVGKGFIKFCTRNLFRSE